MNHNRKVDFIIVHLLQDNTLMKGSELYCGKCGKPVGTLMSSLTMPFTSQEFLNSVINKTIIPRIGSGVTHMTCGNNLFEAGEWKFVSEQNYYRDAARS